ncbi:MAG: DASS family sodium-coupled anion symporter, partial [Pseudomonadota bacterium]
MLAIGLQLIGPPFRLVETLGSVTDARGAWIVLSLLLLMATWWVSEAIPIPVTALLPMVILPLSGVQTIKEAAAPYMHPIVVLLMGGFIIAKVLERWNLHARIALNIVVRVGAQPSMLVAGFMGASALLSMWISNTATAIMMMPIALSVATAVMGRAHLNGPFTYALLLAIAYGCSLGGLGTPIGTPTNLIVIGYLNENTALSIGFGQWMMLGIPIMVAILPAAWFVLTKWAFPLPKKGALEGQAVIQDHLAALGKMSIPEKRVLLLFAVVVSLWVFRRPLNDIQVSLGEGQNLYTPFAGLTDHVIAILGVILCFLIPAGGGGRDRTALLDWKTAESIPWGVVLLFGGGMSLAAAITQTGLSAWLGGELAGLTTLPTLLLIALLTSFVIFATEVTSNVATASALMPV